MNLSKFSKRRRPNKSARNDTGLLLRGVWGFIDAEANTATYRASPYFDLCDELLHSSLITPEFEGLSSTDEIIELAELVRKAALPTFSPAIRPSIEQLLKTIRDTNLPWLKNNCSDKACRNALDLAVRTWLFTPLPYNDIQVTLNTAIQAKLLEAQPAIPSGNQVKPVQVSEIGFLSDDFSEKALTRRGGFRLLKTSDLSLHLVLKNRTNLLIFQHAGALQTYQKQKDKYVPHFGSVFYSQESFCFAYYSNSEMYPNDLLREVDRTYFLLWPISKRKTNKRARKISKKNRMDIEAHWVDDIIKESDRYDLNNYPVYRHRLAEIQRQYNAARPKSPKQWWYDRRLRIEWTTLLIAVIVFVLTVVFGVISSVTGILQVYVAFRYHKQ